MVCFFLNLFSTWKFASMVIFITKYKALTEAQLADMFKKADKNGDAVIDKQEFVDLLTMVYNGETPSPKECELMFKAVDTNSNFFS